MEANDINTDNSSKVTRRKFLKIFSGVFAAVITLTLIFPMIKALVGTIIKKKRRSYSKVTSVDSLPENQPVEPSFTMIKEDAFIRSTVEHEVWVVKKSDSDVTVFSPICPHLGCRYQWHQDRNLFICPCHHSIFTVTGKVVSGPAPRPLDTLPKKIANNYLYVIWERFKPGIAKKEII